MSERSRPASCSPPVATSASSTASCTGRRRSRTSSRRPACEVIRGDVRDAAARETALQGVDEVVHLAAIVGDPACARDPETAAEVNIEGTRAIIDAAQAAGATRLVFASTCSNYGRMVDPTIPIDESGELRPVSLYAEQKVAMEQLLLGQALGSLRPTCLRFATVYGVAPRMRFDLTVNEFTRDLWADRKLEVFGEQFWRPYVHVSDAARAIRTVLDAPDEVTERAVFNVGDSARTTASSISSRRSSKQIPRGEVTYVRREEDPRDYKVSFDKINADARLQDADDRAGRHRGDRRRARGRRARRSVRRSRPQLNGDRHRVLLINQYAGSPSLGMEFRPSALAREWARDGTRDADRRGGAVARARARPGARAAASRSSASTASTSSGTGCRRTTATALAGPPTSSRSRRCCARAAGRSPASSGRTSSSRPRRIRWTSTARGRSRSAPARGSSSRCTTSGR